MHDAVGREHAVANPLQAVTATLLLRGMHAFAVIAQIEEQPGASAAPAKTHPNFGSVRLGVADRVGQGLLDDAIDVALQMVWKGIERDRVPGQVQAIGEPGILDHGTQRALGQGPTQPKLIQRGGAEVVEQATHRTAHVLDDLPHAVQRACVRHLLLDELEPDRHRRQVLAELVMQRRGDLATLGRFELEVALSGFAQCLGQGHVGSVCVL